MQQWNDCMSLLDWNAERYTRHADEPKGGKAHPLQQVRLIIQVQNQELLLIARLVQPGTNLFKSRSEGPLLSHRYWAQRGVAPDGLWVPMDCVTKKLCQQIDRIYEQIYVPMVAPTVSNAKGSLQIPLESFDTPFWVFQRLSMPLAVIKLGGEK